MRSSIAKAEFLSIFFSFEFAFCCVDSLHFALSAIFHRISFVVFIPTWTSISFFPLHFFSCRFLLFIWTSGRFKFFFVRINFCVDIPSPMRFCDSKECKTMTTKTEQQQRKKWERAPKTCPEFSVHFEMNCVLRSVLFWKCTISPRFIILLMLSLSSSKVRFVYKFRCIQSSVDTSKRTNGRKYIWKYYTTRFCWKSPDEVQYLYTVNEQQQQLQQQQWPK